jgi:hypothetical protein
MYRGLWYCSRFQCGINRVIVLHSVSRRYVQGHYSVTVCVSAIDIGLFMYCGLRQYGM